MSDVVATGLDRLNGGERAPHRSKTGDEFDRVVGMDPDRMGHSVGLVEPEEGDCKDDQGTYDWAFNLAAAGDHRHSEEDAEGEQTSS